MVQFASADGGEHRAPSISDVLIAANAELADRRSHRQAVERLTLA